MSLSPDELDRQLAEAESEETAQTGVKVAAALEDSLASTIRSTDQATEADEDEDEKPWEHETFVAFGEKWEARTPTQEGLMAFALATSKFIDPAMQSNFMGLFLREHLSPASVSRVFERLISFDDPDFDQDAVAEILRSIAELATSAD